MSDEQRQSGSEPDASPGGSGPVERPSTGGVDPGASAVSDAVGRSESLPDVGDGVGDGPTVDLGAARRSVVGGDDSAGVDEPGAVAEAPEGRQEPVAGGAPVRGLSLRSRWSGASVIIAVLLALLGFTLVVQLKTNSADPELAATRQEDLVRILSDLESQEERLRQDIAGLEDSQRQLASGAQGRQAALDEATRRADELGILAGTLPARGPGLTVTFSAGSESIEAATVLDAVQELRGAGAEAMQISGGGATVRIVASTFFLDDDGGIAVSGRRLVGPYTITVIGDPSTMRTALNIPGGVVASVSGDGGNVTVQEREVVDVTTLSAPLDLKHARPVS
ncbi:DUF881 domain-containing protein [Micromonospora sp. NBC_01796]|uniref:DUF881 domain-containing protein n=1 Tax=Micromonospora sp. NBC_01796 TaxID=2975987 RepID=UPI002DDA841F|nr:DUF881 domain-containing protein [Micromonospora sp. NBC_01796]WSA84992.1 DUF881 domain-containing protein [Micromonospora sp. NBC_01796]